MIRVYTEGTGVFVNEVVQEYRDVPGVKVTVCPDLASILSLAKIDPGQVLLAKLVIWDPDDRPGK
jgi:hypothetical protein